MNLTGATMLRATGSEKPGCECVLQWRAVSNANAKLGHGLSFMICGGTHSCNPGYLRRQRSEGLQFEASRSK
jgi:hypothetical protein